MRRPFIALLLLSAALFPVVSNAGQVWFNPEKDELTARQDQYDCESKSAKFSYDMGKAGKTKVVAGHLSDCMQALGYKLVPEEQANRSQPRLKALGVFAARAAAEPACGGERPRALTFVNASDVTVWLAEFGNGFSMDCVKDSECGGTNKCVNKWCTGVLCSKDSMCGNKGSTFCQFRPGCSKAQSPDCPAVNCQKNADCPFVPTDGSKACLGTSSCQDNSACPAISCKADADCPSYKDDGGNTVKGSCSSGTEDAKLCATTCETHTAQCLCTAASTCPSGGTCKDNRCTGGKGYCAVNCSVDAGRCACRNDGLACPDSAACEDDHMCTRGGLCRYKTYPTASEFQPFEIAPGSTTVICVPDAWGGRLWPRTGCGNTAKGFECKTGGCDNKFACEKSGDAPSTLFEANYDTKNGMLYYDVSLVDAFNIALKAESSSPACPTLGGSTDLRSTCPAKLQLLDDDKTTVLGCMSPCGVCNLRKDATRKEFTNNPLLLSGVDCAPEKVQLYCCLNADGGAKSSCNMGNPVCFDNNDCGLLCDASKNDEHGKNAACGGNACTDGFCQGMTCGADHYCSPRTSLCKEDKNCNTGEGFVCDLSNKNAKGQGFCKPGEARAAACCGPVNPAWQNAVQEYVSFYKKGMPTAYSYQYDDPSSLVTCPKGSGVDFKITISPKK